MPPRLALSLVAGRRQSVNTAVLIPAMLPTHARKSLLARQRHSSPAPAKIKSKPLNVSPRRLRLATHQRSSSATMNAKGFNGTLSSHLRSTLILPLIQTTISPTPPLPSPSLPQTKSWHSNTSASSAFSQLMRKRSGCDLNRCKPLSARSYTHWQRTSD